MREHPQTYCHRILGDLPRLGYVSTFNRLAGGGGYLKEQNASFHG